MREDLEPDEIMEEESQRAAPKKGKSKLLMFAIPIILIQVVVAYFVVVKYFLPHYPEGESAEAQEAVEDEKAPDEFGFTWGYSNQTITLWDGKRTRYCVIGITFESEDESVVGDELPKRESQIKDIVRGTVSSKTMNQLINPMFQEDTLKSEILAKVNYILPEGKSINRIFLDEYVLN